jgi:hypothetical protein
MRSLSLSHESYCIFHFSSVLGLISSCSYFHQQGGSKLAFQTKSRNMAFIIFWHVNALRGNGSINASRYAHATIRWMLQVVARQKSARQWTRWVGIAWLVFSMWSAPCPALDNSTVNTFTIIEGVFYAWFVPKVYRGQQRSFARSRRWEAVSERYEAVMEKSWQCSAVVKR